MGPDEANRHVSPMYTTSLPHAQPACTANGPGGSEFCVSGVRGMCEGGCEGRA
jgi:hypothetical protein